MSCKADYNGMQKSVMKGAGSAIKKILSQKGGKKKSKKGGMKTSSMIGIYLITLMAVAVMSQYGLIPSIDVAASAVFAAAGPEAAKMYDPGFMKRFIENIYLILAYPHIDAAKRPAFCSDPRGATSGYGYFWADGFEKFDQTCAKGSEATGIFITGALLAMVATMGLSAGITLKALAADRTPQKPKTAEISTQATSIDDSQRYLQIARSALDDDPYNVEAIRDVAKQTEKLLSEISGSASFANMADQLAEQLAESQKITQSSSSSTEGPEITELSAASPEPSIVASRVEGSSMFSCLAVAPPNIMASQVNRELLASAAEERRDLATGAPPKMPTPSKQTMDRGGKRRRKKTRKHRRKPKRRHTKRR